MMMKPDFRTFYQLDTAMSYHAAPSRVGLAQMLRTVYGLCTTLTEYPGHIAMTHAWQRFREACDRWYKYESTLRISTGGEVGGRFAHDGHLSSELRHDDNLQHMTINHVVARVFLSTIGEAAPGIGRTEAGNCYNVFYRLGSLSS